MDVALITKSTPYADFFASQRAVGAITALAPISTPMGTSGVLKVATAGAGAGSFGKFIFCGVGTAAQTFVALIVGWDKWVHGSGSSTTVEYVPKVLANITCTLGSKTSAITAANKMVTTITVNNSEANYEVVAADANEGIALLKLDLQGSEYVSLVIGTGTATSGNGALSQF